MTAARLSPDSAACSANRAVHRTPMATPAPNRYIVTIEHFSLQSDWTMKLQLGLRTLALLAFVAASTVVIVKPELIGAQSSTQGNVLFVSPP
ncbi:MAG: hypothetical protein JWQ01_766 [Massilia sp.]|jgi:hypothetical protein|nr:hypothetical protein [Massilia sp.]